MGKSLNFDEIDTDIVAFYTSFGIFLLIAKQSISRILFLERSGRKIQTLSTSCLCLFGQ